jgi:transposase-like protein
LKGWLLASKAKLNLSHASQIYNLEYRMDNEIKNVKIENEFKVCPSCGYKDGFHSMFKKEDGITKWLFICPSCHEIFDIGFTV